MTPPTKPKAVHVYRSDGPNPLWIDQHCAAPYPDPTHRLCRGEYLGEYVPAPGPVVAERWEVRHRDHVSRYKTREAALSDRDLNCGNSCRIFHIVTRKKAK